ncbi:MAG: CapA family protein [Lentisphaerae bacterium]|nr:CapA family protein [Lentisphaerota bacterium]
MAIVFSGDWLPTKDIKPAWPCEVRVGNIECAIADSVESSGKAYTSVLPMSCTEYVGAGMFTALSLANNHVYDAGALAFAEMRLRLHEIYPNVQFFGTSDKPYAEISDKGKSIAVIASLERCRSRGLDIFREEGVESLISDIRGRFDCVYVYPHWGKEGEYTRWPSPRQRKLARRWIDAGADGVFGSHSHVFQGREFYKGRPIYYSLGNFYFPHPENKLYEGTDVGLFVEIDKGEVEERFVRNGLIIEDAVEIKDLGGVIESISEPLKHWTTWRWARAVGPFNLKKNSASWKIRLKKSFVKTLPKYLVWQILPNTLLFRVASLFAK